MKTIPITEFKAHALKVLSQVAQGKVSVIVTKRGKPCAKVVPYTESKAEAGRLADTCVFEKDIVSPLGEELWDACR